MSSPPTIPRRVFQTIALVTLTLPSAVTWWFAPRAFDVFGGGALGVLGVVLVLLGAILAWALALMPLRRLAGMRTLAEEMSARGARDFRALMAAARVEHQALAASTDPCKRRRYHVLMGAAGAAMTVAFGVGTFAMMIDESGVIFASLPIGAAVSAVLVTYHFVRAVTVR